MEYRAQVPHTERRLPDENAPPAKKVTQDGIVDLCVNIPIFQDLSIKDKNDLVNSMHILEFQPGEVIVQQGMAGCNMYIVVDGNPLVIEKATTTDPCNLRTARDHLPIGTQSDDDITVLRQRLSPGDTFGEESLIHSCPHGASVIVPNERPGDRAVTLWALSGNTFHSLLTVNALHRRKLLSKILSEVHLFSQLCNHTRIQVEKAFVMKEFKEGDAIIGDKVEARFHVIATGEAIHMTNTANRRC
ncbi:hypothetical protein CYMTET_12074 [Cymbomonas tetramitiformis]|uniref:Cyclic nucleotide-binding domain-containing protein n=1 Tax=Cymbomonas tetramitiformis TaxID=36881 RepID=A0AAE0GL83_9CHLO|nr:hypothetical protein CYMTET_12074 [Cymbomonas tetramitiformis]